jgi:hypothetical protein
MAFNFNLKRILCHEKLNSSLRRYSSLGESAKLNMNSKASKVVKIKILRVFRELRGNEFFSCGFDVLR